MFISLNKQKNETKDFPFELNWSNCLTRLTNSWSFWWNEFWLNLVIEFCKRFNLNNNDNDIEYLIGWLNKVVITVLVLIILIIIIVILMLIH